MKIEQIGIDQLIPYARNARTHSNEQVAQVAASIREFGFTNPVLIDGEGGIIAGHGRVMAARKLKLAEVPCIRLAHLSETQKRAYIIADNKLALNAGWDEDMLALELKDLNSHEFKIELLGFDSQELINLMDLNDEIQQQEYSLDASDKFQILIEFDSEEELQNEYNQCQQRGLKCKLIQ